MLMKQTYALLHEFSVLGSDTHHVTARLLADPLFSTRNDKARDQSVGKESCSIRPRTNYNLNATI